MRLPKINQKVSVRILTGSWQGLYSTYVEGVDQTALTIAQPMYGGVHIPLLVGEEVTVEFIDGGERLAFSSHVLGHFTQVVPIVSLMLPAPGSVRRHQQRDFVRVDVNLPLRYRLVPAKPPESDEEKGEAPYHEGRTLDISGSGAQVVAHEPYSVGTRLDLLLTLPGDSLVIEAEVIRVAESSNPREAWLGVRFTRVDERDRERIVRYIFAEQRFRRQKGLL